MGRRKGWEGSGRRWEGFVWYLIGWVKKKDGQTESLSKAKNGTKRRWGWWQMVKRKKAKMAGVGGGWRGEKKGGREYEF